MSINVDGSVLILVSGILSGLLCSLYGQVLLACAAGSSLEGFRGQIWEFPRIRGTLFGGPYNKDPTI